MTDETIDAIDGQAPELPADPLGQPRRTVQLAELLVEVHHGIDAARALRLAAGKTGMNEHELTALVVQLVCNLLPEAGMADLYRRECNRLTVAVERMAKQRRQDVKHAHEQSEETTRALRLVSHLAEAMLGRREASEARIASAACEEARGD